MNTTAATPTRRITAALHSGRDAMAGRRGRVHGDRSIAPNGARPARVAKQFTAGVAPLHAGSAAARAVVCGGGWGEPRWRHCDTLVGEGGPKPRRILGDINE